MRTISDDWPSISSTKTEDDGTAAASTHPTVSPTVSAPTPSTNTGAKSPRETKNEKDEIGKFVILISCVV